MSLAKPTRFRAEPHDGNQHRGHLASKRRRSHERKVERKTLWQNFFLSFFKVQLINLLVFTAIIINIIEVKPLK